MSLSIASHHNRLVLIVTLWQSVFELASKIVFTRNPDSLEKLAFLSLNHIIRLFIELFIWK